MREAREHFVGSFEEDLDPLVVHHFRAVNPGFEHHTLGIYEQVTFPAFDLLTAPS